MNFFKKLGFAPERNQVVNLLLSTMPPGVRGIITSYENINEELANRVSLLSDEEFYKLFASTDDPNASKLLEDNPSLMQRYNDLWERARISLRSL